MFNVTTTIIKSWTQALNSQRMKRYFQSWIQIRMPLGLMSSELQSRFTIHVLQYCKVLILHADSSAHSDNSSFCRGLAIKHKWLSALCLMNITIKTSSIKSILFTKPSSIIHWNKYEHFLNECSRSYKWKQSIQIT